ncbi:hypothetical protein CcaverHIS002_0203580 [Cutaneotrichosporon cavernicola]|uniref:Uncharacterized protein n=1 Tax=Cutaneotrichosporon cavernicola TaxID=279322 RepID=A0AA48IF88_9TREE|nr:uncharacterized protein CcaverHIS019_0203550 [Cutaneotrichosporon cavernicola]BEI81198.1 hypothetical protein CcaverHIS002_0203580 [Cutaneotrichosporon cavernicola]BEI88993.1 hypothetical protein CcaverHIS019_0203550 [Cutaneotrichosporon cavernicola]BEI96769.1 hypothetical protein CcaverHIS631_0203580 [Cutaneotrichosporon cavernicola]BEJ04541.1 hypothetical protein CcaverHIS641_0203580 [Cutaneotrichosporon cavernicola]
MSHHLYEVGIKNCAILTDRFNHCCTIYTEILRDQGLSPEAVYDEVVGVTTHLEILLVAIATEKRSIPSVMILRIARRHQVWAFPAFLEVLSGSLDKLEATTLETLNRSRRTLARLAACFDDIVDEVQGYDISDGASTVGGV